MANENIVIEEKDGIVTTNYYNGETPPKGTVAKLVQSYDGCNYTSYNMVSGGGTTLLACTFSDGSTINTWEKYKVSDKEFIIIHKSHIYNDLNIGRW